MSHTKIQTIHGLKPPACQLGHILKSSVCALLFFSTGEEGCGSFVQQYRKTADWHPCAHGGIHLFEIRNPLHAPERVSFIVSSVLYM